MSPSSLYPQGWHRFVSKASLAHSLHERRALASWVGQLPPSGFDFSPQFTVNPESLGFPLLIVNYLEVWESHPDVKGWGSMSEGLVSTCVMVNWFWHCSLFSPPPSFPSLSTPFMLNHGTGERPQCSWHSQASILSLQVTDRDPGFEITNLGFSLILPYKPTRKKKTYQESLFAYRPRGRGCFGSTDVLGQSLFWPLPRMTQLHGIWHTGWLGWACPVGMNGTGMKQMISSISHCSS